MADEDVTKTPNGRVWPNPRNKPRRRFCAWFESGRDIRVKHFGARKAAVDWLHTLEAALTPTPGEPHDQ